MAKATILTLYSEEHKPNWRAPPMWASHLEMQSISGKKGPQVQQTSEKNSPPKLEAGKNTEFLVKIFFWFLFKFRWIVSLLKGCPQGTISSYATDED